jgi:hypothetical protein
MIAMPGKPYSCQPVQGKGQSLATMGGRVQCVPKRGLILMFARRGGGQRGVQRRQPGCRDREPARRPGQQQPGTIRSSRAAACTSSASSWTSRRCRQPRSDSPPRERKVDLRIERPAANAVLTTVVYTWSRSWTPRYPSESSGLFRRAAMDSRGPRHSPENRKVPLPII